PGWMRLIGYSLRLAFPSRPDRLRLVGLIQQAAWVGQPTIAEAIQLISRELYRFSPGFQETFWSARTAFAAGTNAPELEALWSAVLEAASVAVAPTVPGRARVRYQLILREDELQQAALFLLPSRSAAGAQGGEFTVRDEPVDEYKAVVRAPGDG